MAYPRALALAEVAWTPASRRSWDSFVGRLPAALRGLDRLDVNYRLPHVEGLDSDRLSLDDTITIALRAPVDRAAIHYTLDGSMPTISSRVYTAPVRVPLADVAVTVTAAVFTADARAGPPRSATFARTTWRPAESPAPDALLPGLRYAYYEAALRSAVVPDSLRATREGRTATLAPPADARAEQYAVRFTGFLRVPDDALYDLSLVSDDGSRLVIGDRVVIDNDGFHGAEERRGMIALRAGLHPLRVDYFQATGGAALSLRYRVGEGPWSPVPPAWFTSDR
jgi:hexosaminidase